MKKAFFMVGILAALSMTAFGAETDGTVDLTISGKAIEKLELGATETVINFGSVLTGKSKTASSTLTVSGTKGEAVTITADLGNLNGLVTLTDSSEITASGKKLTLAGTDADKAIIELEYSPKKSGDDLKDATLTVTVAYDDTTITQ